MTLSLMSFTTLSVILLALFNPSCIVGTGHSKSETHNLETRNVNTGKYSFALPIQLKEVNVVSKDVRRWKFTGEQVSFFVEIGGDLPDYQQLKSKYMEQVGDFSDREEIIDGEKANIYQFSTGDQSVSTARMSYQGLFIENGADRAHLVLEGESAEVKLIADSVFNSIRIRKS